MWLKVDDHFHEHPKVRGLSPASVGIWTLAGSWCGQNSQAEGFVPETVLRRWTGWRKAAQELQDAGLWEPTTIGKETGWVFHDWLTYNDPELSSAADDDAEKVKKRRARALRGMPWLKEKVIRRDGTRCGYCGTRVNFSDRKSATGGTLDHIDPDGPNADWNLVVACRKCNGEKRDRTPEEAGMTLLNDPRINAGSVTDPLIGRRSVTDRSTQISAPLPEAVPVTDRSRIGSGSGPGSGVDLEQVG